MFTNKLKMIFNFDGLKLTQYAFLVIATIILVVVFGIYPSNFESVFKNPVLTVQILLVLSYPFCYLLLKSIRKNLIDAKNEQILPLWIILICQVSSLNIVCSFLLIYGIYQTYGSQFLSLKYIRLTKTNKSFVISLIPIVLLYAIILFVRIRLGMLG